MRDMRSKSAMLVLGLTLSMAALPADERTAYREGLEAFQNTDYGLALRHFQQAEQAGLGGVRLYYNLGVTHYRLGHYEEARDYFSRIQNDAEWGALAEYNLGLIAERQDDFIRAAEHYRAASRKTDSEKIRALAQSRLDLISGLETDSTDDAGGGWVVYLSGTAGHDDNPALVEQTQLLTASGSDAFMEVIGNASGYLRGGPRDGIRLSAGFYGRRYNDMDEFNVSGVDAGIYLDDEGGNWRFVRGLRVNNYWIGGEQYSTGGNLVLQVTRRHNAVSLDIRNDLGYLSGADTFAFISGFRNRLSIDLFQNWAGGQWRIGYINEYNDRDDLEPGDGQFFSYSYLGHSVYGELRKFFGARWSLQARLEYQTNQYFDDNRVIDLQTGDVKEARREEDRITAATVLRYSVNNAFSVFGEYRYTDNDTNFDRFTYQSNQIMLGLDTVF